MTTPGTGLTIASIARAFLAGLEEVYAAAGSDLPTRRYLAAGNPSLIAWDCEQVVVALAGVGWGQIADAAPVSPRTGTPTSVYAVRHASLSVQVVRCTPSAGRDGLPNSEEMDAAGELYMRDAGLVSQALVVAAASVREDLDEAASVQLGVINTLGPEGGYHAIEGTVLITAGGLA